MNSHVLTVMCKYLLPHQSCDGIVGVPKTVGHVQKHTQLLTKALSQKPNLWYGLVGYLCSKATSTVGILLLQ